MPIQEGNIYWYNYDGEYWPVVALDSVAAAENGIVSPEDGETYQPIAFLGSGEGMPAQVGLLSEFSWDDEQKAKSDNADILAALEATETLVPKDLSDEERRALRHERNAEKQRRRDEKEARRMAMEAKIQEKKHLREGKRGRDVDCAPEVIDVDLEESEEESEGDHSASHASDDGDDNDDDDDEDEQEEEAQESSVDKEIEEEDQESEEEDSDESSEDSSEDFDSWFDHRCGEESEKGERKRWIRGVKDRRNECPQCRSHGTPLCYPCYSAGY